MNKNNINTIKNLIKPILPPKTELRSKINGFEAFSLLKFTGESLELRHSVINRVHHFTLKLTVNNKVSVVSRILREIPELSKSFRVQRLAENSLIEFTLTLRDKTKFAAKSLLKLTKILKQLKVVLKW